MVRIWKHRFFSLVFCYFQVSDRLNYAHNGNEIINFSNATIKNIQYKKIMLNYNPTTQKL